MESSGIPLTVGSHTDAGSLFGSLGPRLPTQIAILAAVTVTPAASWLKIPLVGG